MAFSSVILSPAQHNRSGCRAPPALFVGNLIISRGLAEILSPRPYSPRRVVFFVVHQSSAILVRMHTHFPHIPICGCLMAGLDRIRTTLGGTSTCSVPLEGRCCDGGLLPTEDTSG
ncbi:hypothetical protein VTK56DRAFT_7312 [Thermocarpiscus australiensis]